MRKTQNISDIYVVGHQTKQPTHTRKREDKAMQERFARLPWPHWLPHTPRENGRRWCYANSRANAARAALEQEPTT